MRSRRSELPAAGLVWYGVVYAHFDLVQDALGDQGLEALLKNDLDFICSLSEDLGWYVEVEPIVRVDALW